MLPFPPSLLATIAETQAKVRVGYPWWLRPWLMRGVVAITLGRRIFIDPAYAARAPRQLDSLLRHELAHVRQVNRHGLFGFLGRYVGEFLRLWLRLRDAGEAYRQISFEVEARAAERDETQTAL